MGECLLTSNTVSRPFAERNVNSAHARWDRGSGRPRVRFCIAVASLRLAWTTAAFGCVGSREWR